jgi:hypothetical protein
MRTKTEIALGSMKKAYFLGKNSFGEVGGINAQVMFSQKSEVGK